MLVGIGNGISKTNLGDGPRCGKIEIQGNDISTPSIFHRTDLVQTIRHVWIITHLTDLTNSYSKLIDCYLITDKYIHPTII